MFFSKETVQTKWSMWSVSRKALATFIVVIGWTEGLKRSFIRSDWVRSLCTGCQITYRGGTSHEGHCPLKTATCYVVGRCLRSAIPGSGSISWYVCTYISAYTYYIHMSLCVSLSPSFFRPPYCILNHNLQRARTTTEPLLFTQWRQTLPSSLLLCSKNPML